MTSHREGGATTAPDTRLVRKASNALQTHPTFGNLFSGDPAAFDEMAAVALREAMGTLAAIRKLADKHGKHIPDPEDEGLASADYWLGARDASQHIVMSLRALLGGDS